MKSLHFLAGLPRSGSTLLANLLSQREDFYATGTSGLFDVCQSIWNCYGTSMANKASPEEGACQRVLRAALLSHHHELHRCDVLDKNRLWPMLIPQATAALGYEPKVILTLRDVRDVAASFEKLYRKRVVAWPQEATSPLAYATTHARVAQWLAGDGLIGQPLGLTKAAIHSGASNLLCVSYTALVTQPEQTLATVEEFLELPPVKYRLNPIPKFIEENDLVWGMGPLHSIHSSIDPTAVEPQWPTVLGPWAEGYGELNKL